jgi:hypothetical protein
MAPIGGDMNVALTWPALTSVSRVVPTTATVVLVTVVPFSGSTQSVYLYRPSSGGYTTATSFTGLNPGACTITVTAYAFGTPGNLGTPLATIVDSSHSVTSGGTITINLTMASTVNSVVLAPNATQVTQSAGAYHTQTLTALPEDASGNVVLTSSAWTWSSGASGTVSVAATTTNQTTVTGVATGTNVTITATEGDSGKSGTAKVDCVAALSAPTTGSVNVSVSR